MKLEEIQALWAVDAQIDQSELGKASITIPDLHNKYYKMFIAERTIARQNEFKLKELIKAKFEWYTGTISEEELKARGWQANPRVILKSEVPMYMDSDQELAKEKLRVFFLQEKVEFLESIIKSFVNRGFLIKAAIDWIKFQNGA